MKTLLTAVCLALATAVILPAPARVEAAPSPVILLDSYPVQFPVAPIIVEDRTLVPFRAIAEALGVDITWHEADRSIDAVGLGANVHLAIGRKTMYVNGTSLSLDVAPQIVNDRTLIPLRAFSQAFGARVGWDQSTYTASITSPLRTMRTMAFYAVSSFAERDLVAGFSEVAYGWATLTPDGLVDLNGDEYRWPEPAGDISGERLLADARRAGTRRHLMIHETDRDDRLTALVTNPDRVAASAESIARVVQEKGFDGVVLDLEGLGLTEQGAALERVRTGLVDLVAAVSARLKPSGKETVVSVHPLNGAYHGYDYAGLSRAADTLQLMAHDYRQDGAPEPADKVDEAIRLALEAGVPRTQLLLGIVTAYETPATVPQKAGLAKRYSLAGVSVWRLGSIGAERMAALNSSVTPQK